MAIPLVVAYSVIDELEVKGVINFFIDAASTITLANLQTWANGQTAVLDAVTGAQILGIRISFPATVVGAKSSPVAGSRVEQTALFDFNQANSNYVAAIDVLAWRDTLIAGTLVDLGNADVGAFRDYQLAATAGVQTASKFGNLLLALRDVLLTFRKRRKQLDARSKEGA
jgi:hypothetical protein